MIIAPVFFYFGLWDRYLSFSLYAGQQRHFLVRVEANAVEAVPEELKIFLSNPKASDGHRTLSPSTWSLQELNVPLISEWRILQAFSRELCENGLVGSDPIFFIGYRHFPEKLKRYYRCDQIEDMTGKHSR